MSNVSNTQNAQNTHNPHNTQDMGDMGHADRVICAICTICRNNLLPDATVTFNCGHVFHRYCSEQISNGACPMCRRSLSQPINLFIETREEQSENRLLAILSRLTYEAYRAISNEQNEHNQQNGIGVNGINRSHRSNDAIPQWMTGLNVENEPEQLLRLPLPNTLPGTGRRKLYINVNSNDIEVRIVRRAIRHRQNGRAPSNTPNTPNTSNTSE